MGLQEGLLSISDVDAPSIDDYDALCAAVLRECTRRKYAGVLLDFETAPTPTLQTLVSALDEILNKRKLALYLPQSYARQSKQGTVLIGTAVSGGNFTQYLREQLDLYHGRIALDVERLQMDFTLPATKGVGVPLTGQEVTALRQTHAPGVFFSQELCTRYFTYQSQGETHFVLFDDSETLQQKIQLGDSMGIQAGFLVLGEVEDLLPGLLRR